MAARKNQSRVTPIKKGNHRVDSMVRTKKNSGFPWKTVVGTSAALGMVGVAWNILRNKRDHANLSERAVQPDLTMEGSYKEDFSERL